MFNGYYASKYYKYLGGKHWALNIVVSSLLFPIILFIIWFILNSIAWSNDSTAAVPFGSVFFVMLLWFIIYMPLTILGGITGKMKCEEILPNVDSSLPRLYKPVPEKKFY